MPANNTRPPADSPEDFLDRLRRHPELQAEFEAILDIVDNSSGDVVKADDAEELVADRLQRLGQQAIENWALRKHQKIVSECDARSDLTRKEKKALLVHPLRKSRNKRTDLPSRPTRRPTAPLF